MDDHYGGDIVFSLGDWMYDSAVCVDLKHKGKNPTDLISDKGAVLLPYIGFDQMALRAGKQIASELVLNVEEAIERRDIPPHHLIKNDP